MGEKTNRIIRDANDDAQTLSIDTERPIEGDVVTLEDGYVVGGRLVGELDRLGLAGDRGGLQLQSVAV